MHLFRRAVGMLLFGPERLPSLKKMLQGLMTDAEPGWAYASDLTIDVSSAWPSQGPRLPQDNVMRWRQKRKY